MTRRALIVNDVRVVREMLAVQLRECGFAEQDFAADGVEALQVLERIRPDVVVTDVHMPLLDGFQLVRLMRSADFAQLNEVPVVLMSATFRDHTAQRLAAEVGAQAFLQWPFSPRELAVSIERAMRQPFTCASEAVRILVAEDEATLRTGMERVLVAAGFNVRSVGDGLAALEVGEAWHPHLVLCDYMMPGLDGAGVLAWFREHRPDTPVIIVTAFGSETLAVEMMKAGAYDYITKPYELRQLPVLCRSALEKHGVKGISRQFGEMIELLQRSEGRYRALFEHAGEAIFLCDQKGRVVEANAHAAELLGSPAGVLVGKRLRELFVPADPRQGADVLAALQQRGDLSLEAFLSAPGRRPLPVELSGAPVVVHGDGHSLVVVRDLSDRKWIGAFVRHEHQFLKQLHRTTRLIDSEAGFGEFLGDTLRGVLALLEMDAGAIASTAWGHEFFGTPAEHQALTVEGGIQEPLARAVVEEIHVALADRSLGAGEPDVQCAAPDSLSAAERAVGLRTRVAVDLTSRGARHGLLVLWRHGPEPVPERDTTLLRSIAGNLALALENAALLARVSSAQDDWQRTFDAVSEAVLVVDRDGRVGRVNRAACERTGKAAEALVGRDALEFLYAGAPPPAMSLGAGVLTATRTAEHAIPGLGAGVFAVSASPLFTARGEYRGAALVARDVTEARRAQQQLLIAEKMSTIGRMAAGVTHELNNPAAFVLLNVAHLQDRVGELQQLLDEYRGALLSHGGEAAVAGLDARKEALGLTDLVPELAGLAAESLEGMQRIRGITQELRLFSRVREEEPREFDLNGAIESATVVARHEVRHRARLVRDLSPIPHCLGDAARMTQVFVNLLVNAAQAIPEGHADEHRVEVRTRLSADGRLVAEVADTGAGISAENRARIFDPFFTTKEAGQGTGLGLALCYEIVKHHGGEIEVESEPGQGTTFRILLPASPGAPMAAPAPARDEPVARARILFIEDEVSLHRAVRRVLREHELHFAESGREAMMLLEADQRFDLIVCDVVMPDVSGVEVFLWVQRQHPELLPRLAFMTGGVRSDEAQFIVRTAGRPVLEKPVDAATLRRLIADLRPR